jgi:hypothetical protein
MKAEINRARRDVEKRIKELKAGLALDRLSCSRFLGINSGSPLTLAAYILVQTVPGGASQHPGFPDGVSLAIDLAGVHVCGRRRPPGRIPRPIAPATTTVDMSLASIARVRTASNAARPPCGVARFTSKRASADTSSS